MSPSNTRKLPTAYTPPCLSSSSPTGRPSTRGSGSNDGRCTRLRGVQTQGCSGEVQNPVSMAILVARSICQPVRREETKSIVCARSRGPSYEGKKPIAFWLDEQSRGRMPDCRGMLMLDTWRQIGSGMHGCMFRDGVPKIIIFHFLSHKFCLRSEVT